MRYYMRMTKTMFTTSDTLETIAKRSLVNCHVLGMHSVVVNVTNGKLQRIFCAEKNHMLWFNKPNMFGHFPMSLSLGFHGHHSKLTFEPIFGEWDNITIEKDVDGVEAAKDAVWELNHCPIKLSGFKWNSPILTGEKGFFTEVEKDVVFRKPEIAKMAPGCQLTMEGSLMHTVSVVRNEEAAWMVNEQTTYAEHDGLCWSNVPLDKHFSCDPKRFYQPMSVEKCKEILERCGVSYAE